MDALFIILQTCKHTHTHTLAQTPKNTSVNKHNGLLSAHSNFTRKFTPHKGTTYLCDEELLLPYSTMQNLCVRACVRVSVSMCMRAGARAHAYTLNEHCFIYELVYSKNKIKTKLITSKPKNYSFLMLSLLSIAFEILCHKMN